MKQIKTGAVLYCSTITYKYYHMLDVALMRFVETVDSMC